MISRARWTPSVACREGSPVPDRLAIAVERRIRDARPWSMTWDGALARQAADVRALVDLGCPSAAAALRELHRAEWRALRLWGAPADACERVPVATIWRSARGGRALVVGAHWRRHRGAVVLWCPVVGAHVSLVVRSTPAAEWLRARRRVSP